MNNKNINKYYLYKKVLTSKACIEELETESVMTLFGGKNLTIQEAFINRTKLITQLVKTQFIEDLENVSGKEIISLFAQATSIERDLKEKKYAETLLANKHPFIEVLEGLFELDLIHIENYERAENLLTGKRNITVILDNNNTHFIKDGKEIMIQTEIENNIVTIQKCKELIEKLNAENCYPKKLDFSLNIYTETKNNECGDYPEECLLRRNFNYDVENDYLRVVEE